MLIFTEAPKVISKAVNFKIGDPVAYESIKDLENYPIVKCTQAELNYKKYCEEVQSKKSIDPDPKSQSDDNEQQTEYQTYNSARVESYEDAYKPKSRLDNLKSKLDLLADERSDRFNAIETAEDFDMVENTKTYYKTSKDNFYTPIKALAPNSYDWKIKVRVCKKFEKREWKNARSSGSLLNIHLVDMEGSKIIGTFFNQAADMFDPEIQENKVYLMSHGQVKMANQKYAQLDNPYTLLFDRNAEIIEVEDDKAIHDKNFKFSTIRDMQEMEENTIVDFIGVVHNVGPINDIFLKNGQSKSRKLLLVTDDSGMIINL